MVGVHTHPRAGPIPHDRQEVGDVSAARHPGRHPAEDGPGRAADDRLAVPHPSPHPRSSTLGHSLVELDRSVAGRPHRTWRRHRRPARPPAHRDGGDLQVTTIQRTTGEKDREQARRVKERRRQRALDRSRRNTNPDQYEPSARQEKSAKRRADNGLPATQHTPHGPRKSRADGKPRQAYRRDRLSRSYRRGRGVAANDARAAAIARRDTARTLAGDLVGQHGTDLTIEAGSITAWAKVWGRAVHAFTPGLLIAAVEAEVEAVSGGAVVMRAGTRQTAMSQHCLCQRRAKKPLSQRTHHCPDCGLKAGRDALSAVLASCVDFADPTDPVTATVDYHLTGRLLANEQTRHTLDQTFINQGVQVRLCASTDTPNPTPDRVGKGTRPPAVTAGSAPRTGQVPTTTPDETPADAGDHAGTRPTTNPSAPPDPQSGLRDTS